MTRLDHYRSDTWERLDVETDRRRIARSLLVSGASYAHWPIDEKVGRDASVDRVLRACAPALATFRTVRGLGTADVVRVRATDADLAALRGAFGAEHTHADCEARYFVDGVATIVVRAGLRVWALTCEAGDFVEIPAKTPHWLEIGDSPSFTAVQLFRSADGWVPQYTGSAIEQSAPRLAS